MEIEKSGTPAIVICTDIFRPKAEEEALNLGLGQLRLVEVVHPLGGIPRDQVVAKAAAATAALVQALAGAAETGGRQDRAISHRVEAPATPAELQAFIYEQGWSDGLPVLPPTEEAVAAMCRALGRRPDQVVGAVPPAGGQATIEAIAANAVMAGARPEHMPVIVAALEAMLAPEFNLYAIQSTTHPVAPLVVVNGPIVRDLGLNAEAGLFGPAKLANAVIGRAIRLVLWNVGGGVPGAGDRSTQGSPTKFSFVIAENEAANPWEPLHVSRGFDRQASTVTVFGVEGPHNVNDHESLRPEGILTIAADAMRTLAVNTWFLSIDGHKEYLVVLGPEHAATIAGAGWSKADVQQHLFERCRRRRAELRRGGMYEMRDWPAWQNALGDEDMVPIVPAPADIQLVVAGGAGKHSAILPSFGSTKAVTRQLR